MDEEKQFFKKQLFTCKRGSYGKKPYSRHDWIVIKILEIDCWKLFIAD